MKRLFLIAVLALIAVPAAATDFAGHHLLIPIAGRTSGALGTHWKTDLFVTNAARRGNPVAVEVYFIADGFLTHPVTATLRPRESMVLRDVIRGAFGKDEASGIILVVTREPQARLTARARIYNAGAAAGQYGQTVPAMPLTKLSREAFLPGLSGVNGNRSNVGIANPSDKKATAFVSIFHKDGEFGGGFSVDVEPYSVLRLNDVFSHFQTGPLEDATIQVTSSHGVYPYASIVRSDSGDADFVTGTGTEIDDADVIGAPPCATSAPLVLAALPAEGWSVIYKNDVNPFVTTPELEARHDFKADSVYHFGTFYSRTLTPAKVAALRCEPSVRVIEQNAMVPVF